MNQCRQGEAWAKAKPGCGLGVSALCVLFPYELESQISRNQERDCSERRGSWLPALPGPKMENTSGKGDGSQPAAGETDTDTDPPSDLHLIRPR